MTPASQRIRQGLGALLAFSQPMDTALAAHYLSPSSLALFRQMQRSEQIHSLNVLRDVLAQGPATPDLAGAALLHDLGKIRCPLAVWQKTLVVLVRALWPNRFARWSRSDPARPWQRPFVVYAQHPAWGADLVAAAGASPTTVWLVAHHADPLERWSQHPDAALLRRLRQADDRN